MLHGKVLRSPHAHARIKSINIDKALALAGVKAIITGAELPELPNRKKAIGEIMFNPRDCAILGGGKYPRRRHRAGRR